MNRPSSITAILACVLLGVAAMASGALASETPDEHPVIGSWAAAPPTFGFILFGADGSVIGTDPNGGTIFGTWQSTGDRTADFTVRGLATPGQPASGIEIARASIEVAADGTTATVTATVELPTPDGGTTGQLGPVVADLARMAVEPMGSPVAPFPNAMP
jgi:hypothetical protein